MKKTSSKLILHEMSITKNIISNILIIWYMYIGYANYYPKIYHQLTNLWVSMPYCIIVLIDRYQRISIAYHCIFDAKSKSDLLDHKLMHNLQFCTSSNFKKAVLSIFLYAIWCHEKPSLWNKNRLVNDLAGLCVTKLFSCQ